MQLDLESCGVRSFRETDAAELARHANNRKVWLQLRDRFSHPYTIDDARGFIAFAGGADPETLEGCMRRSAVKDGAVQDQLLYAILREDGVSART